ncbi:MAG: RCC1 repeat-containing protein [Nitrospirota bacterium]|nr:RCC1 repeat-containing protein [Nitrospirota bacterium]
MHNARRSRLPFLTLWCLLAGVLLLAACGGGGGGGVAGWKSFDTGALHSVGVKTDGTLWAWGDNFYGQLGDGTRGRRNPPVKIGTDRWQSVAAGDFHTVAIRTDGTLWTWGDNVSGQLGLGAGANLAEAAPVQVGTASNWKSVAAGGAHTVAIQSDGTLWAWGNNVYGELGLGTSSFTPTPVPTQVGVASTWKAVAAGGAHTVAIQSDGTLWAWGQNTFAQLGNGGVSDLLVPTQTVTGSTWQQVTAGTSFTAAIKSDGTLWAWGEGGLGQLGDGSLVSSTPTTPLVQEATLSSNWKSVAAGDRHTVATRADGTLWVWGDNASGQLGLGAGALASEPTPVQVGAASNWSSAAAGLNHTVASRADGTLWGWGSNPYGQTGNGVNPDRNAPAQVGVATTWATVSAGDLHSVATQSDGTLWAWGDNAFGQVGNGVNFWESSPTWVGTASNRAGAAAGGGHSVTWRTTTAVSPQGFGLNISGQLGDNSFTNSPFPVTATGYTGGIVAMAAAGGGHSALIDALGKLWTWGLNSSGQLGNNAPPTNIGQPVMVGAATWFDIAAGGSHTAGIQTNGTLWTWGAGGSGQLGDGLLTGSPVPVQVGAASNWSQVSAGFTHTVAVRTDGTLWAWGDNSFGQLGQGTNLSEVAPLQVGTATNWVTVAAGARHTVAIRTDGTLWAWGDNEFGELGDGTFVNRAAPVQIGTDANWAAVAAGGSPNLTLGGHTLAIRTNGTLWSWGVNDYGQLGNGLAGVNQMVYDPAAIAP